MAFDLYIGIDYSGAETSTSRLAHLQVFACTESRRPEAVTTPAAREGQHWNWSRKEIAEWLVGLAKSGRKFIAGIDHPFSFPNSYIERYRLETWDQFLDDFCLHWPTDQPHTYVDFVRDENPPRTGSSDELRLVDRRSFPTRSVFRFQGARTIAKAAHAGIPWLRRIRRELGERLHIWPFDGWDVSEGKSVLFEVDPVICRKRYPREERTEYQHVAYSVARRLFETDRQDALESFFHPLLTDEERRIAALEGWTLGVG